MSYWDKAIPIEYIFLMHPHANYAFILDRVATLSSLKQLESNTTL